MSSTPRIEIRAAAHTDIPFVLELIQPFVQERKLLPRTESDLERLVPNGFTAILNEGLVGFAAVEVYSKKMAEVQCLAVSSAAQGFGVGKRLIQSCITRARELEISELMAITSSEQLFTSCGFHYSLPDQKKALFVQTRDPH